MLMSVIVEGDYWQIGREEGEDREYGIRAAE